MMLTFTIENVPNLPDGGPLSFSVNGKRGFDLGRDTHLDWTLPDPELIISSKHCEVRYYDNAYWLHDLSTNGTFVNGSQTRMVEPYRLRNGDRLVIGRYIVAVKVEGADAEPQLPIAGSSKPASASEWWTTDGEIAPPIDPRELKIHAPQPRQPDFLDWAYKPQGFVPDPNAQHEAPPAWQEDDSWISPPPQVAPSNSQPVPPPAPVTPKPQTPPVPPTPAAPQPAARTEDEPAAKNIADIIRAEAQAAALAQARVEAARQAALNADGVHDDRTLSQPRPPAQSSAPKPQTPPAAPARKQPASAQSADFVQRFAQAAGIPPEALSQCDPEELAATLGGLMREISSDVMQLLRARYEAKRLARSADQTMIEAKANNPLKFSPTPQDALAVMFGPPTTQYLNAAPAFRQAFDDLKSHQIATLSAMQGAVSMLVEDLDPVQIEADAKSEGGLSNMLSSRKARMWDTFVARWSAKAQLHENGLLGAFMFYFPQCYDRSKSD